MKVAAAQILVRRHPKANLLKVRDFSREQTTAVELVVFSGNDR